MSIKIGTANATVIKCGNRDVKQVILSNNYVWNKPLSLYATTLPDGVESLTCIRKATNESTAETGQINAPATVYYGDELYWAAVPKYEYQVSIVHNESNPYIVKTDVDGTTAAGISATKVHYTAYISNRGQAEYYSGISKVALSTDPNSPGSGEYSAASLEIEAGTTVYAFASLVGQEYSPRAGWVQVSNGFYRIGAHEMHENYDFGYITAPRTAFTFTFYQPTYARWSGTSTDGVTKTVEYGDGFTVNTSTNTITCYSWEGSNGSAHSDTVRWQMVLPTKSQDDQWSYSKPVLNESDIQGLDGNTWYSSGDKAIHATDGRTERSYTVQLVNGTYGGWGQASVTAPYSASITYPGGKTVNINGVSYGYNLDNTTQWSYSTTLTLSASTVRTGATVTATTTRTENTYRVQLLNPTSGYGSWSPAEVDKYLPYSSVLTVTDGGYKVAIDGTTYTFVAPNADKQYGYVVTPNYTQSVTVETGKTIRPTVTRYVQEYSVLFNAGTGISSIFLTDNSGASSGSQSGAKFKYGTTVYLFFKLSTGYDAPSGSSYNSTNGCYYYSAVIKDTKDFGTISCSPSAYTATFTGPSYGSWAYGSRTIYFGDKIATSGQTVTCYVGQGSTVRWTNTVSASGTTAEYSYSTPTISNGSYASVSGNCTITATNSRTKRTYPVYFAAGTGTSGMYTSTDVYATSGQGSGYAFEYGSTVYLLFSKSTGYDAPSGAQYLSANDKYYYSATITGNYNFGTINCSLSAYTISFSGPTYGSWEAASKTAYYGDKIVTSGQTVICYVGQGSTERWRNTAVKSDDTPQYSYTPPTVSNGNFTVYNNQTITATNSRDTRSYLVWFTAGTGIRNALLYHDLYATSGSGSGTAFNYGSTAYLQFTVNSGYTPPDGASFNGYNNHYYLTHQVTANYNFGTINAKATLSAPVCRYDSDSTADIGVENNNGVTVSVYIDNSLRGTLAANASAWYNVHSFGTYYNVQFKASGYGDSPIVRAYSGNYDEDEDTSTS